MDIIYIIMILFFICMICISSSVIGIFAFSSSSNTSITSTASTTKEESKLGNIVYCNDQFTICESDTDGNNGIELKEYAIYKLKTKDGKTAFYMNLNMILRMTEKKYTSIDEFLKDVDSLQQKVDDCLNYYSLNTNDQKDMQKKQIMSLKCSFFNTTSQLINTLKTTILSGLTEDLLNEYLDTLKEKALEKKMTTFEYFVYYAITSKLTNKNELVLIK